MIRFKYCDNDEPFAVTLNIGGGVLFYVKLQQRMLINQDNDGYTYEWSDIEPVNMNADDIEFVER